MLCATLEDHGKVALLRLNNGVTNAIGPQLLQDIAAAAAAIRKGFNGLVLAGGHKFFSIGLDLPQLLSFDRTQMAEFLKNFNQVVLDLYSLPLPAACAITGHATAGGAILALTCDFRLAAAGRTLIGFNEINIGVPVPYLADLMLRQLVGDRAATAMLYGGEFLDPPAARAIGLVDDIADKEQVESRAVAKIDQLASKAQPAFATMKQTRVESICTRYRETTRDIQSNFLDCWFQRPVQKLLHQAAEKF